MDARYRRKYVGNGRWKEEHKVIAEKAIGHDLPDGAEVHHVDGNGFNNDHSNLVICPSRSYHFLLHRRQRALAACGNANWLKCRFCKQYDDPQNLAIRTVAKNKVLPMANHRKCENEYVKQRRLRNRLYQVATSSSARCRMVGSRHLGEGEEGISLVLGNHDERRM